MLSSNPFTFTEHSKLLFTLENKMEALQLILKKNGEANEYLLSFFLPSVHL